MRGRGGRKGGRGRGGRRGDSGFRGCVKLSPMSKRCFRSNRLKKGTAHFKNVQKFNFEKPHKQDGTAEVSDESGYLPTAPDHQTDIVALPFSRFFNPRYPLL